MIRTDIATHTYTNGRWGQNTASLVRVISEFTDLPSGYSVSNGASDSTFYTCPVEAKRAYRRILSGIHFHAVDGAYDRLLRAGDFMTCADPRDYIRRSNALLDACVAAGMDRECADHVGWAGEFVTQELLAA